MPPKSKRRRQSAEAALKGRQILQELHSQAESDESRESSEQADADIVPSDNVSMQVVLETHTPFLSESGPSSSVNEPGPSSSVGEPGERGPLNILEEFVQDWIATLDRDD